MNSETIKQNLMKLASTYPELYEIAADSYSSKQWEKYEFQILDTGTYIESEWPGVIGVAVERNHTMIITELYAGEPLILTYLIDADQGKIKEDRLAISSVQDYREKLDNILKIALAMSTT